MLSLIHIFRRGHAGELAEAVLDGGQADVVLRAPGSGNGGFHGVQVQFQLNRVVPGSYTHLDVYKRQTLCS